MYEVESLVSPQRNGAQTEMSARDCFLIAPIGPPGSEVRRQSDALLHYIIAPPTAETGYSVIRADQITAPGLITAQIARLAIESSLVIADLSGRNPNVLYELGIRHASGKPAILITTDVSDIPFDVASLRTIVVDINDIESVSNAKTHLVKAIRDVEVTGTSFSSPVTAAVDLQSFSQRRRESQKQPAPSLDLESLFSVLTDVKNRMESLEHKVTRALTSAESDQRYSRRVFIVHGRDAELKHDLARFLEKLDFQPVILHEQPDKGQTIFAKLNGEMADVGFAFIILTPDDVGALSTESKKLQGRARQNVVFKHGLFAGCLTPQRVCAIRRGDVDIPSDLHGVLYKTVPPDGGIHSIALEIANELRAAGYKLDANKLLTL